VAMADAAGSLALVPAEALEEAPLDAAAIRRCGAPAPLSTRIIPRRQRSGSSGLFSPSLRLFSCWWQPGGGARSEVAARKGGGGIPRGGGGRREGPQLDVRGECGRFQGLVSPSPFPRSVCR
jgi:hypothetical protein